MGKLRILMNSEASYTYSGFGKYYYEVLKRLAATGKYELAELASYGFVNDPRDKDANWMIYANCVRDGDPRAQTYHSKPTFQWGEWRLDRVMLDFKPDVLMSVRDPWMIEFEKDSAFRDFFHLVWMPTHDSSPAQESWIDSYKQADGIFTYSDWALERLKHEGAGQIKLQRSAPPGVDLKVFCPTQNKAEHRQRMGLSPDMLIVGSVMRNQRRKLYPDLFAAFEKFLEKADESLAKRTYLLIHTSYPDAGWNIPQLLKLHKIGHKVLFSYVCKTCGKWFPSHFQDIVGTCPACGNHNAIMPNVQHGVSEQVLANIYQCMDLYIQLSICEGFGMPHAEATACGIPTMGMPYSATEDILKYTSGIPIKIAKRYLEIETGAYRMMPDNDDCADKMIQFLQQPAPMRQRLGFATRKGCEQHYNWDRTAKIWEAYFDNIKLVGNQGKWDAPYRPFNIPESIPEELNNVSNTKFIQWMFTNVLQQPFMCNSYLAMRLTSDLNTGLTIEGANAKPTNRESVYSLFKARANNMAFSEKARCGFVSLASEDYLDYANMKKKALELKDGDIIE